MRDHRRRRPRLESLESKELLSTVPALALLEARRAAPLVAHLPAARAVGSAIQPSTLHGTFFAHGGNSDSGTIYSLFASGRLAPLGPAFLTGGIQSRGTGPFRGNLLLELVSRSGIVGIRLTAPPGLASQGPRQFTFAYQVVSGPGAGGTGTAQITLTPNLRDFRGRPFSVPGFFGNSTITLQPGAVALA